MTTLSFKNWQEWAPSCARLPAHAVRTAVPPPPENTPPPAGDSPILWLDSAREGRYSLYVAEAWSCLRGYPGGLEITPLTGSAAPQRSRGNPFLQLREWAAAHRGPVLPADLPPPNGGLFGLLSYDLARLFETLPVHAPEDPGTPLFTLLDARSVLVYDHQKQDLHSFVWSPSHGQVPRAEDFAAAREAAEKALDGAHPWNPAKQPTLSPFSPSPTGEHSPRWSFREPDFCQAVRRIQEWIASGNTYQVNLSLRQSRPLRVPPEAIYSHLRRINPSPYMGFFRVPETTLVCGSPELLLKRRGDHLETRPIAGTRPRGRQGPGSDENLARELVQNPKERAEHLMLVDLLRNDLGRVCRYGTVRVPEFMTVEKYSHVQHIVSLVEGTLAPGSDSFDALAAVFPGGTITGAPKVRTMEIIETLEPVRRGPYTGSLGWIHASGQDMEWNIIIRTLWTSENWAHVQSGAGIVADSDPAREYQESLQKAQALWQAVEETEARFPLAPKPPVP